MAYWIWGIAAVAYLVFVGWYHNWSGPLTPKEVEGYLAKLTAQHSVVDGRNQVDTIRKFLSEDDGREFFMLNLVKVAAGKVADPKTGELKPAPQVLEGYTSVFIAALMARAGHPAVAARKVGGYFDAWGVEADPGWTIIGYMRYRSRRDLAELATDPRFAGAHEFKFAAMPSTYSFPTQPIMLTLMKPTYFVGLILALLAALAHLGFLTLFRSPLQ
ncbi:MAG TPA: hypothetical protein DCL48_00410 [Alphaproteobacteria bacterium]|nr:hypothetical protein [Alphaproteobacteria bacterium]